MHRGDACSTNKMRHSQKALRDLENVTASFTVGEVPTATSPNLAVANGGQDEAVVGEGVTVVQDASQRENQLPAVAVEEFGDQQLLDDLLRRFANASIKVKKRFFRSTLQGFPELDKVLRHLELATG